VAKAAAKVIAPISGRNSPVGYQAPSAPPPASEAVSMFQRGMEAMQRHAYADAARAFQAILMGFPGERTLVERTRVYLALCERELNRRPVAPKTIEERLTSATAALNNGNDAEAAELARSVLGDDPKHDLALYLLAVVHARRGEAAAAVDWLAQAMDVSPDVRAQARHDVDFQSLRELESFRQLLDSPVSARSDAHRNRRPR